MAKQCKAGVYQMESGFWAYRFSLIINGRRVSRKKTTDLHGNKLKTQKEAAKAREEAIANAYYQSEKKNTIIRKTVKEVFSEYCESGRTGKAYATIKKQDSLWENHLKARFGKKFVDSITVADVEDYLSELYFVDGFSYQYTESFLKMFYLIFGQAYSRNYLAVDIYNKLCVNKNTKISMPKLKTDDDTEIIAFTKEQVKILESYFAGSNVETAFLLGCYCGLRINECFGLKWDNVDLEAGTITIDRQMQYQNGLIKLVPLKTHNARRTVYLSERVKSHLEKIKQEQAEYTDAQKAQRQQNQIFIEDINGKLTSCLEMVNTLPNGKRQTLNSFKYHSREIKERFKMDFKYHYLRHTYGTRLAELNTPMHILCNQMGHASGKVTQRYYLSVSPIGIDVLKQNLNTIQNIYAEQ